MGLLWLPSREHRWVNGCGWSLGHLDVEEGDGLHPQMSTLETRFHLADGWLGYRGIAWLARNHKDHGNIWHVNVPLGWQSSRTVPRSVFPFCTCSQAASWWLAQRLFCINSLRSDRLPSRSPGTKPLCWDSWCSNKAIWEMQHFRNRLIQFVHCRRWQVFLKHRGLNHRMTSDDRVSVSCSDESLLLHLKQATQGVFHLSFTVPSRPNLKMTSSHSFPSSDTSQWK